METRLVIERFKTQLSEKQNNGIMFIVDGNNRISFKCFTLELPDKGNANKVSCIPAGCYDVTKRNSPKYGDHFHVTNVSGRSYILIHQGNYYTQIEGCILVGTDLVDINGDGILDVTNSVNTMKQLNSKMPKSFKLTIME